MKRFLPGLVVFLLLAPALHAQRNDMDFDAPDEEEGSGRRGRSLFIRPAKEDPAEQLEHARSLAARGRLRGATRHFDALVREWHDAPEAAAAQRELARVLEERKRYVRAFEAYQYLADFFGDRSSYAEILDRQFRIANHVMDARLGRFLWFKGYRSPERALPLFNSLLQNAPEWDRSMQVRYVLGTLYQEAGEFDAAVPIFQGIVYRDPEGPLAEPAALGHAACMYRLARRNPRDERACRSALSALVGFLSDYPGTENEEEIREQVATLKESLAGMYYERALFYDRQWKRDRAALQAYRDFIRKFPNAEPAERVRERIRILEEKVQVPGES